MKISLLAFRLMLPALLLGQLAVAAGPAVAAGGPGNFSTTPDRSFADAPTLQAEAADVLKNVLAASDIKRFTVLDADRANAANAHAAWIGSDRILGTLTIIPGETDDLLKVMPGIMTRRAATQCNGAFWSGAIPDAAGTAVARLFTACRNGAGDPVTAYYLGVPRKKGGIFVFGLVAMGSEDAAKSVDASIRDAVIKVLAAE